MSAQGTGLPPELVRQQLKRVLDSPDFDASERNRNFLAYIVEETLSGRAERIKAYSIATTVFGRDDSFDPQMDPIVRIEASRLRRSLERYYLTGGGEDPVTITIPKGAYVPEFAAQAASAEVGDAGPEISEALPAAQQPVPSPKSRRRLRAPALVLAILLVAAVAASWFAGFSAFVTDPNAPAYDRDGPSIFVLPFAEDGDVEAFPNFTRGLTRELVVGLTQFQDLFVYGPETSFSYGEKASLQNVIADLGVDFVLTGGTTVYGTRFAVDAQLIDGGTGQYVWATRAEGDLSVDQILAVRDEIANRVARSLAQPYGVIFSNRARNSAGVAPESLSSYDCVLRFYIYWKSYRREFYPSVHACLKEAIAADPDYAEAYAALSLIHSDAYRFGYGGAELTEDPRKSALSLARRAIEISPNLARGYHALMLAHWLNKNVDLSLDAARKGLALNPYDTELMAELGMRYAWRDRWDKGLPLLREAYKRNPAQPSGYRLALFIDHYLAGRFEAALTEAKRIEAPNLIYTHVTMAMALAELGKVVDAQDAVSRILAIAPNYGEEVVADLEKRNIHPRIIAAVIQGLRKAGLEIPEEDIADAGS